VEIAKVIVLLFEAPSIKLREGAVDLSPPPQGELSHRHSRNLGKARVYLGILRVLDMSCFFSKLETLPSSKRV
jgi:hypothetical protein